MGSTFESGVLKAIGSLGGGGSMRQISGENGPRAIALDLLKEITRPGLRDLKVQFEGLRVARVYPQELPNLPGGSQQIILGRYLPQGKQQAGRVIVTGRRGDRDVCFEQAVSLADAEHGNSFIPRLWARMHLDYLLQQGATPTIKDDIIALSEEYHIITPYTSLLVLESDADRERFKVKRGFVMRDGEKFFAEGRDNANFELLQQQMKRAGGWRIGLRMSVLRQLSTQGRDAGVFQPQWGADNWFAFTNGPMGGGGGFSSRLAGVNSYSGGTIINGGFFLGEENKSRLLYDTFTIDGPQTASAPTSSPVEATDMNGRAYSQTYQEKMSGESAVKELSEGEAGGEQFAEQDSKDRGELGWEEAGEQEEAQLSRTKMASVRSPYSFRGLSFAGAIGADAVAVGDDWSFASPAGARNRWFAEGRGLYWNRSELDNWLNSLFGTLPPAPSGKQPPAVKPELPEEVLALSKKLLRNEQLELKAGGLRIDRHTDNFNARFAELASRADETFLAGARSWLIRSSSDGGQTVIQWCDGKQREIFNRSFLLGRARKAVEEELKLPPIGVPGYVLVSLADSFNGQKVSVRHPADGQTLLTFRALRDDKNDTQVLIDTKRNVVLSIESRTDGKVTSSQRFGDFVEVAGAGGAEHQIAGRQGPHDKRDQAETRPDGQ